MVVILLQVKTFFTEVEVLAGVALKPLKVKQICDNQEHVTYTYSITIYRPIIG